jgi:hypothetical protein
MSGLKNFVLIPFLMQLEWQDRSPKSVRWRAAIPEPQLMSLSASCARKDATVPARVSAANAILDPGWGKAPQAVQNGDDGAFKVIHKIERIIVHPGNSDSWNLSRCCWPPCTRLRSE